MKVVFISLVFGVLAIYGIREFGMLQTLLFFMGVAFILSVIASARS